MRCGAWGSHVKVAAPAKVTCCKSLRAGSAPLSLKELGALFLLAACMCTAGKEAPTGVAATPSPWFAGVSAPCVPRTVLKNVPLGCIHPATTFLPTSNPCLFTKLQEDVAKRSWVSLAMPREAPGAMLRVRHPNITGRSRDFALQARQGADGECGGSGLSPHQVPKPGTAVSAEPARGPALHLHSGACFASLQRYAAAFGTQGTGGADLSRVFLVLLGAW